MKNKKFSIIELFFAVMVVAVIVGSIRYFAVKSNSISDDKTATLGETELQSVSGQALEYAKGNKSDVLSGVNNNDLIITTETVKMEKKTGDILIPGTTTVEKKGLNILEIVPDYSYDYVQYVVGGYNGKLSNDENITYGASASEKGYEPISASEMEGYFIQTCGATNENKGNTNSNNVTMLDGFFPNTKGPDLKGIVGTPESERHGYYEYVGADNGGIYAIDSYVESGTIANTAGMGNVKPIVLGYTRTYDSYNDYDKKNWTDKVFNPVFEFCYRDMGYDDYYEPVVLDSGRKDYILVTEEIDGKLYSFYQYAGVGMGDFSLNFTKSYYRNKQSYDQAKSGQSGHCYAVSKLYDIVDETNGEYYACISGWDFRESPDYYEWGYDFNKSILSAVMYSRQFKHPYLYLAESTDFGWIWHEAEAGSELYNKIDDGTYYSSSESIKNGEIVDGDSYVRGTRLYLKNHFRYGIVHNELFKLFVMQDVLEQYVEDSPKMLDIKNGRWDESNNCYSEVNDKAIKAWEDAGNKITVNVRIPGDVTPNDISECDMIIIGKNGDGGFNWANTAYGSIRTLSGVTTSAYSAANDISFDIATEIYLKVCSNTASIACPYEIKDISDGGKELNLSKMYKMIYCVSNWTQSDEDLIKSVVGEKKEKKIKEQGANNYWSIDPDYMKNIESQVMRKGSGRDLFKDFLISQEGNELSKSLYGEGNALPNKTTDFIYIDRQGNIVIREQNDKVVQQKLDSTSYTYTINHYPEKILQNFDIYTDSAGRSFGMFEYNFLLNSYTHNNFLLDRYRADMPRDNNKYTPYPKSNFVYNADEGYKYKFYYDSRQTGVYKNALLYMSDSDLFSFDKTGSKGMLQIGVAKQNAHPMTEEDDSDKVGTLELVGYAVGKGVNGDPEESVRDNGIYNAPDPNDSEDKTYEQWVSENGMYFQHYFEDTADKSGKVLYITEEELEQAKRGDNGIFIYVIVRSDRNLYKDIKNDNPYNPYIYYAFETTKDGNGKIICKTGEAYKEWSGEIVKYQKDGDEYVTQFRLHIGSGNLKSFSTPTNGSLNKVTARIGAVDDDKKSLNELAFEKTTEMFGQEEFYICVRDTFDLD